jgi:hypothetical protein
MFEGVVHALCDGNGVRGEEAVLALRGISRETGVHCVMVAWKQGMN